MTISERNQPIVPLHPTQPSLTRERIQPRPLTPHSPSTSTHPRLRLRLRPLTLPRPFPLILIHRLPLHLPQPRLVPHLLPRILRSPPINLRRLRLRLPTVHVRLLGIVQRIRVASFGRTIRVLVPGEGVRGILAVGVGVAGGGAVGSFVAGGCEGAAGVEGVRGVWLGALVSSWGCDCIECSV